MVRDRALDDLYGRYLYADFCTGELRSLNLGLPTASGDRSEGLSVPRVTSFGEDADCRIYVASFDGPVYRLTEPAGEVRRRLPAPRVRAGGRSRRVHNDPPNTTITKRPKDKTKKKTATFEFTSNEPGRDVRVQLDGGPFAPCSSPDTLKVKKGKHHFEVRATDAAGNVDGSPATDDWKVKKKKKKR